MSHRFKSNTATAEPTWAESTWADDGGTASRANERLPREAPSSDYPGPLERLYARHISISTGRAEGDSRLVHLEILERLAASQRIAESEGWTSLALVRVAGMGQLRLVGVPPMGERRQVVPDRS